MDATPNGSKDGEVASRVRPHERTGPKTADARDLRHGKTSEDADWLHEATADPAFFIRGSE